MFFSRVASLFILTGAFVSAAPVATNQARQVDLEVNVTGVLDTLLATTSSVLPQIAALTSPITEEVALPLVQELLGAVDTATTTLSGLAPVDVSVEKREASEAVAQLLSGLLSDVSNTVNPILVELNEIPAVAELLTTLEPLLSTLLNTVEGLLPGVIALVSGLVGTVTGLLGGLLGGLGLGGLGGLGGILGL